MFVIVVLDYKNGDKYINYKITMVISIIMIILIIVITVIMSMMIMINKANIDTNLKLIFNNNSNKTGKTHNSAKPPNLTLK